MSFEDLPKVSASHIQSSASQRSLEAVFCLPDFIARAQNPDYGKDYDVELCANGSALNVQFAVQLKSVEKIDLVSESRLISFQIETSRLNYLSQTPCGSLIVIFEANTTRLFYEWIAKAIDVLDQKGAEWRGQEAVTIHIPVKNVLNQDSRRTIHENVLALHRRIQEVRSGEQVIGPGKQTPEPSHPIEPGKSQEEMLVMLASKGIGLVAGGLQKEVLAAYSMIPSIKWGADALHLLTLAFAYEHSGLPLQSLSYANGALSCKSRPLSPSRAVFARQLALISQLNLGQIDTATYYKDLEALLKSSPDSEEAKGIRLELIFHELSQPQGKPDHIGHVEALVKEARLLVGTDTDWGLRLRLAKIELYAGDQYMLNGRMQIDVARKLGIPMSTARKWAMAAATLDLKQAGLARIAEIVKETERTKRVDVFAMCCLELAVHQFALLALTRMLAQTDDKVSQPQSNEDAVVKRILSYVDSAADIFEKLGVETQHAKALRLKADILCTTGDVASAQSFLTAAKRKAQLAGIDPDSFRLSKKSAGPPGTADIEDSMLNATDDDLRRFAESIRQSISLPESRLENILTDLKSIRLIHQEKRRWCKHLEILQELAHTQSRETHYAIDPPRTCKCLRYGHETRIGYPSAGLVIESFKGTYCNGCVGKEI